jgi:tyrosyl-tRNA synthetase
MNTDARFDLIKKNTAEIITDDELKQLLSSKKDISVYYGTAPTGPVHIGYMIPGSKMFDFDKAGIRTKILIADIHAALDDLKTSWESMDLKAEYYKKCFEMALPWENKPTFVKGSEFQRDEKYMTDVLRLSTLSTVSRATRAASEVTRMKNPKVSELIYPIMQALDEQYLDVDIQLGGLDQRHIFVFAREYLPLLGYKPRLEIMTPLVASLQGPGTKMSASIPESCIKIYESEEKIISKIKAAYAPVGDVKDNPTMQLSQFLVFPVKGKMKIERPPKFGGDAEFKSYEELKEAYEAKKLHPSDLKSALAKELIDIFAKPRKYFEGHQDILKELGDNFMP